MSPPSSFVALVVGETPRHFHKRFPTPNTFKNVFGLLAASFVVTFDHEEDLAQPYAFGANVFALVAFVVLLDLLASDDHPAGHLLPQNGL